ncbi:MAG TPA: DNA repair ATPase, partial [Thermoanaerobaculia bacterium]
AVEIIRAHFRIVDRSAKASLLERITRFFTGKKDTEALEYLEQWGESFWQETDYRIREVTTKLENDIRASIQTAGLPIQFSAEGAKRLSAEERVDVVHRTQDVINQVHIRKLSAVLELLDRVLDDPQEKYYIVIDRLDENWVEDDVRYPLIRALIETSRDFRKIRHAKVILALRIDLIERVFHVTRDTGFQEEKCESLYLPVTWSARQLIEVLDARINHLLRSRRADTKVTHKDVLPERVGKKPVMEYMLDRTLMRPRDVILFFNYCIAEAVDRPQITATMIRHAEGEYSKDRLRSLGDEWRGRIPHLLKCVSVLKGSVESFRIDELDSAYIEELCLGIATEDEISSDELTCAARQVADCELSACEFAVVLVSVLFRVGLVGVRVHSGAKPLWSSDGARTVTPAELSSDTRVLVHPCFHRALGVVPSDN